MITGLFRHRPSKVFLSAPLATEAESRFNREIHQLLVDLEFDVYAPHFELPPHGNVPATEILHANMDAVRDAKMLVIVLDKPGLGVAVEIGIALALKKTIVLFRSDSQGYLGKVIEGLWEDDSNLIRAKARTMDELREALTHIARPEEKLSA